LKDPSTSTSKKTNQMVLLLHVTYKKSQMIDDGKSKFENIVIKYTI